LSFASECRLSIDRMVPDRERMTSDCVVQPPARYCTPRSSSPSVIPLGVVLRPEPPLQRTAHALERAGGDDPLRGAADAHQQVDAGALAGRRDRPGDVAVGDELDPGARLADLADQRVVPRAVQDADGHVSGRHTLGRGHPADVLGHRHGDVDDVGSDRAGGDLVHVEDGRRVVHGAPVGDRHHGDGVGHALGHQRGAVDGVDGDVVVAAGAVADLLAVVEHRGLVLLALPDDHDAAHAHGADQRAHRVDRGAVPAVLVPPAHPAAGGHRRGLGDPHQLHGQVAVRRGAVPPTAGRGPGDRAAGQWSVGQGQGHGTS
jgi:hypothetical protein